MSVSLKSPVRYSPDVETSAADEHETIEGLKQALHDIQETTAADYGSAVRSVHAKSHGLLEGELTVHDGLPPELAQGMFAAAGTHAAVLRFSTNPGDILDDDISVPRGLALKILDVAGERLPGAEGATQDFVMVNGPAFAAADPKKFLGNLKLLSKTTNKAEWAKKALSKVLRATEAALEAVGGESSLLSTLGGAPNVHPLGQTYFSQTAFRYGDFIAKFQLVPVSPELRVLEEVKVDASDRPDAIREDVASAMAEHGGVWELRVQLCRDLETMSIEDPSTPWDETASPFITVATLTAPQQTSWSYEKSQAIDNEMRFSVWTGLAAHQPLGGINRVRRDTYQMSADFRGRFNNCPIHEPRALETV